MEKASVRAFPHSHAFALLDGMYKAIQTDISQPSTHQTNAFGFFSGHVDLLARSRISIGFFQVGKPIVNLFSTIEFLFNKYLQFQTICSLHSALENVNLAASYDMLILHYAKNMATLIENKKIFLNYEVVETYEAGLELLGLEVKALRARQGNLAGAYVLIRGGEAYLINAHIPPYQENNTPESYEPYRNRRLLLKKSEIARLAASAEKRGTSKGLTIVPISVYSKDGKKSPTGKSAVATGGKIKVEIALVRGKKKYDKRQSLKKRENAREISRKYAL